MSNFEFPEDDFQVISKLHERKLFNCCELTTFTGLRDALLMSFFIRHWRSDRRVYPGYCSEVDLQNRSASVRAESAKTLGSGNSILWSKNPRVTGYLSCLACDERTSHKLVSQPVWSTAG